MLQRNEVSASFFSNSFENSKEIGFGFLNIAGLAVNYKVYPSPYDYGFMIAFPSKPKMKNGIHQTDEKTGKPAYFNEVYIKDQEIKPILYEAVQKAMQNNGIDIENLGSKTNTQTGFSPLPKTTPTKIATPVQMDDDLPF